MWSGALLFSISLYWKTVNIKYWVNFFEVKVSANTLYFIYIVFIYNYNNYNYNNKLINYYYKTLQAGYSMLHV